MRLTLVIASMGAGGAERVMGLMANRRAALGDQVTIITIGAADADRQRLGPGIRRVALDLMMPSAGIGQALGRNTRRITALRQAIRASCPDVVISFLASTNVLTLLASVHMRVPVIVAERIDPREEPTAAAWAVLRRLLYPRAHAVVVQTEDVSRWALRFLKPDRVFVIPNPVAAADRHSGPTAERGDAPAWLASPGHKVIAIGRLTRQKGFDLLLPAFARCRARRPEWSLVILGEGEERTRLERLALDLGITSAVALPGHVADVTAVLRRGDLFVLPSRYEGFPNALLEAMACRLPVIATDCRSGPREIVRDGVDGLLVPPGDVDAMTAAMLRLMEEPDLRERLGARAVDVVHRFSVAGIDRQWTELLGACVARYG